MLKKISNLFFKFTIFIFYCDAIIFLDEKYSIGNFVCVILCMLALFITVKAPYKLSVTLLIIISVINGIININDKGRMEDFEDIMEFFIIVIMFIAFLRYNSHRDKINSIVREKRKSGETPCPRCGSSRTLFIQGYTETYSEFDYSLPYHTDENDQAFHNVIRTKYHKGHWHCQDCGRDFSR